MEQVTYEEASELLGKHIDNVRRAAMLGVITQIPSAKRVKYFIREQVLLFKGKRLSLSDLNQNERKQWEMYRDAASNPLGLDTVTVIREETQKGIQAFADSVAARLQGKGILESLLSDIFISASKESEAGRGSRVPSFR